MLKYTHSYGIVWYSVFYMRQYKQTSTYKTAYPDVCKTHYPFSVPTTVFLKPIPVTVILGLMDAVSRVESKTQQEYLLVSITYRTSTGQLHNKRIMVSLNNSEVETTRMFNS